MNQKKWLSLKYAFMVKQNKKYSSDKKEIRKKGKY